MKQRSQESNTKISRLKASRWKWGTALPHGTLSQLSQAISAREQITTQKFKSNSLGLVRARGEYGSRTPWNKAREFSDTASGATCTRSGLDNLMREVRRGRVDVIVAYKLDRLGRSLAHLAQLIGE